VELVDGRMELAELAGVSLGKKRSDAPGSLVVE